MRRDSLERSLQGIIVGREGREGFGGTCFPCVFGEVGEGANVGFFWGVLGDVAVVEEEE